MFLINEKGINIKATGNFSMFRNNSKRSFFSFVKIYIFSYSFSKKPPVSQIPLNYCKDLEMKAQLQKGGYYLSSALQLMVLLNL